MIKVTKEVLKNVKVITDGLESLLRLGLSIQQIVYLVEIEIQLRGHEIKKGELINE